MEQLCDRFRRLLTALFKCSSASDPKEILDIFWDLSFDFLDWKVALGDPSISILAIRSPWVSALLKVSECPTKFSGELGFDQDLEASHIDDVIDMLDIHRTFVDASATTGA